MSAALNRNTITTHERARNSTPPAQRTVSESIRSFAGTGDYFEAHGDNGREQAAWTRPCIYGRMAGGRSQTLQCLTHRHHDDSVVLRILGRDYDTLMELAKVGLLAGQALDDAENLVDATT